MMNKKDLGIGTEKTTGRAARPEEWTPPRNPKLKEYTIFFQGKTVVEAESREEAIDSAFDDLQEIGRYEFEITGTSDE